MDTLVPGSEEILAARSMADLEAALDALARRMGLGVWAAMAMEDKGSESAAVQRLFRIPEGYHDVFLNPAAGRVDPVMQRAKRSSTPFLWSQDTYAAVGQGNEWEHMAGFGMREGVMAALHMPRGRHFVIGFEGADFIGSDTKRLSWTVGQVQLALVHAEAAIERLSGSPWSVADDRLHGLTLRELECLRWTAEGKTAWEVGGILSIAERTANKHLDAATTKLGCANKLQAVARALRAGIIT